MLVADYVCAANRAMLTGKPFESLLDACRRQAAEAEAAKVVSLADMRKKLRPESTAEVYDDGRSILPR